MLVCYTYTDLSVTANSEPQLTRAPPRDACEVLRWGGLKQIIE